MELTEDQKRMLLKEASWKGSPRSAFGTQSWLDPKTQKFVSLETAWSRFLRRTTAVDKCSLMK